MASADGVSPTDEESRSHASLQLLEQAIAAFVRNPSVPRAHDVAQRKYSAFCYNRTAELYNTFFHLVGAPDLSEAKFAPTFTANAPFPGKKDERIVSGMAKKGVMHGIVRYEYKGNIIEECRKDGLEHGLRVVCTQMGDIWLRLHSDGNRLAQIVLSSDLREAGNPKPIDEGGLKTLRSHLHLILACFDPKLTRHVTDSQ